MFKWFRKEVVVRDEVAQKIADMLFPEREEKEEDGHTFLIDYSVDHNLLGALIDLENDENDEITRNTIRKTYEKLCEVRQMLHAEDKIQKKARYLVVDTPDKKE
jgi:hypothetical protein